MMGGHMGSGGWNGASGWENLKKLDKALMDRDNRAGSRHGGCSGSAVQAAPQSFVLELPVRRFLVRIGAPPSVSQDKSPELSNQTGQLHPYLHTGVKGGGPNCSVTRKNTVPAPTPQRPIGSTE